jgi:acetyl-CoA carboxylase carboxyltransferase component
MVPRVSVVIDKAFGGAYCAMDSLTTSIRPRFCRHYGFTTGQIAVMGKEAGPFFTYGADNGDAAVRELHQERYEAEYLNMRLAFEGNFVVPLEPEALRQQLVLDVPDMYAQYQAYWQTLVTELAVVQRQCPTLYRELRYGAIRGLIHPL